MDYRTPPAPSTEPPPRHGCLTTYLASMVVLNAAAAGIFYLAISRHLANGPHASVHLPPDKLGIFFLCALGNVGFTLALFAWQKWGFYGLVCTAVIIFFTNLSLGYSVERALAGLLGVVVLAWVLTMGGAGKAWSHLR